MGDNGPILDVLGVRRRVEFRTKIGGVEVTPASSENRFKSAMNALPEASLTLDLRLLAGQPVDYFGTVEFLAPSERGDRTLFFGNVMEASSEDSLLHLECRTFPSFEETGIDSFVSIGVPHHEVMHMLARTAGLSEDSVNVAQMDQLPLEVIDVLIPVNGVQVESPVRLGAITFLPVADSASLTARFDQPELVGEIQDADCHVLYRTVGRRLLTAEGHGLAAADIAIAWLLSRARYGLATLPSGEPQSFSRATATARPSRGRLILTCGSQSGRAWIRVPQTSSRTSPISLSQGEADWLPPEPSAIDIAGKQALLALRRAATDLDPLQRVQALWEAIEFYVAGVSPAKRFSEPDAKRIRRSLPKDIDPELRQRALDLLAKINDAPLMAKLREALTRDEVPVSEAELELLSRVRTARNEAVHGRGADLPPSEDIDYAVSVVSRMVAYKLHRGRRGPAR